jgi:hypothetical protein
MSGIKIEKTATNPNGKISSAGGQNWRKVFSIFLCGVADGITCFQAAKRGQGIARLA